MGDQNQQYRQPPLMSNGMNSPSFQQPGMPFGNPMQRPQMMQGPPPPMLNQNYMPNQTNPQMPPQANQQMPPPPTNQQMPPPQQQFFRPPQDQIPKFPPNQQPGQIPPPQNYSRSGTPTTQMPPQLQKVGPNSPQVPQQRLGSVGPNSPQVLPPPQNMYNPGMQQPLPGSPAGVRPMNGMPMPPMNRPPYQMTSGQVSPQLTSRSPSPGYPPPNDKMMPQSPSMTNSPLTGRHRAKYPDNMGKAYSNGADSLPAAPGTPQSAQPGQPQFFVPGNMPSPSLMQRNEMPSPINNFQSPMNDLRNSFSNMNLNNQQRNVTSVSLYSGPPNVQSIDLYPQANVPIQLNMPGKANPPYPYTCSTLNAVPQSSTLLNKSKIPFGLVLTPYKNVADDEPEVPVVSPEVIVRCRICRAYINPWVTFVEQGTKWKCNICHMLNDVPTFYNWDSKTRQQVDRNQRPELMNSVVEFVATQEYTRGPPQPVVLMFLIDVSFQSIQSGMVATAARSILSSLDSIPNKDNRTKVGFITYDNTIHFYNLNSNLTEPQILVVSDLDDVFIPVPDDLLVNLTESRTVIESFLNKLGSMYKSTQNVNSALGPALNAANKILGPIGGKIIVLQSILPNFGKNSLKKREDPSLYNTSKESTLLQPVDNWYKDFALDCSKKQICVDTFIFGGQYCDLATLTSLPRFTGGSIYFYPGFNASRAEDATKFSTELIRFLSKQIGLEAVLRIRATRGITVKGFYGNFFLMSTDLLQLPNVNPDNCYALEASIEKDLTSEPYVCFQTAILHTSNTGERRIRVITNVLPTTNNLTEVFANADPRAITVFTAKKAIEKTLSSKIDDARNLITNTCIDIMGSYKSAFTSSGQASQLLITENLSLLPVFTSALLKNVAFRHGNIPSDIRSFAMSVLYGSPIENSLAYIYSKLYAIHRLDANTGLPVPNTSDVYMPPRMNLTVQNLSPDGIFLLENSQDIMLWISRGSNPELINALFQKPYEALTSGKTTLPQPNNDYATRITNIIEHIRKSRLISYNTLPYIYIIKEDDNNMRIWFMAHLVEDKLDNELPYTQFISHLREQLTKFSP